MSPFAFESTQLDLVLTFLSRPSKNDHTEIEEELHDRAHIDYDRVAIVS